LSREDAWERQSIKSRLFAEVIEVGDNVDSKVTEIMEILKRVIDPESGLDLVSLGLVAMVTVGDNNDAEISLKQSSLEYIEEIKEVCKKQIMEVPGITTVEVSAVAGNSQPIASSEEVPPAAPPGMANVKNIIAVSSCKGGVGKSTISVNLAYTLKQSGAKVGILDADIYGPSLPTMVKPPSTEVVYTGTQLLPLQHEGVKLMSMGFINSGASIMRGPMVNQILNQFVSLTAWGDLDYLIIDMPPGTGDIQLTLAQTLNITAAIIVTTPQRLSFVDVVKGIDLFDTVNIPCVAVIENMASYESYSFDDDFYAKLAAKVAGVAAAGSAVSILSPNKPEDPLKSTNAISQAIKEAVESQKSQVRLFGEGHNKRLREMWGIENIVSMPLQTDVSQAADNGTPYVLTNPDSDLASTMVSLAETVIGEISTLSSTSPGSFSYDTERNTIKSDGAFVSAADLRKDCRCAVCVEELTGRRLLDFSSVPDDIKPLGMAPIGRYAMSVDWSDGHKSLYPFRQFKSLVNEKEK
jgi:Mrp family chromosome partitioning ATPase